MKVLAVDTATAWQSVAILDDEKVLARHDQQAAGSHAKSLLPTIDRLFRESGQSLQSLDGLVVSIGPGSFTGLRVGLSTMLALRTVTQLPLAIVPTLEAMAWNLRDCSLPLCPVLNSRRGELYWALLQWTDGPDPLRLAPEQVGSPVKLAQSLQDSVVIYGEGWHTESAAIRAALPPSVSLAAAPPEAGKPSALSVGLAGLAKLRRGERAGIGVRPLYVQRSEAEIKFEESGGLSPVARRQAKVARKLGARPVVTGSRPRRRR